MARLFVAVWPPDDVLDLVAALPRPEVEGLRWTTPAQWHVTLRFFGSVELDDAVGALRGLSASTTTADLGPEVGRFGRRILQVSVSGLEGVAAAVVDATAEVGRPPKDRPFSGHVTLARVRDRRRGVDLRPFVGTPVGARWPVTEISLVESHLHPRGANYDVVETVLLREPRTMG